MFFKKDYTKTFLSESVFDMSGTPREDVYIGLATFNPHYKSKIMKDFGIAFSHLKSFSYKGTKLDGKELEKIINFLNENKVKMFSIKFSSSDWSYWKKQLSEVPYFNERICALLYFKLMKKFCFPKFADPNCIYPFTLCRESNIKIDLVISTLRRIARGHNFNIELKTSIARDYSLLRFADYVASAHRKTSIQKLQEFENYKIATHDFSQKELYKAFKLDQKPELAKRLGFRE